MQNQTIQPQPASRSSSKSKQNFASKRSFAFGLIGLLTLVIAAYSYFDFDSTVEIPVMDLWRLIDKGPGENNPKAFAEVRSVINGKQVIIRYSQLSNVCIGPNAITGTVAREVIGPESLREKPNSVVNFRTSIYGLGNYSAGISELLLKRGFTNVRADDAPSIWADVVPMLIASLPILLIAVYVIRKQGGGSKIAKAFGRSKGKLIAQDEVKVTFRDVAGVDEALIELREVVSFLKSPGKYQSLGGRIPKGVLLVGPPGTGKTLLAKAIAGEASVPFFSLSGSDFVEMYAGVGAARVRDMFQQAKAKAPCIIFIDELDALGKARSSGSAGSHEEREQTLNAMLVEMDGFNANSGVIIMAATNRPETLDQALLRPGRFDRHVVVDRPDMHGREEILKVHVQRVRLDQLVSLTEIARMTAGFAGADLANLVNEAALLAARSNKLYVTMKEFTESVERITKGLEKRQYVLTEEEKKRLAFHECAHALAAYCVPDAEPINKVSIIPRAATTDSPSQRRSGDRFLLTQNELLAKIQVLLAGVASEELIFKNISTNGHNDLAYATEIARSMVMDFGMSRLGWLTYRDRRRQIYLADEGAVERNHSEQTAREIDEEIRYIITSALKCIRLLLERQKTTLVAWAGRLAEREVVSIEELLGTTDMPPPKGKPTSPCIPTFDVNSSATPGVGVSD